MKQLINSNKKYLRLENNLLLAIEHLKKGNDNLAVDIFLIAIEDLENILDEFCYTGDFITNIDKLSQSLQMLHECMQNNDIVAMTDTLEYAIYPLIKEWDEGDVE